MRHRVRENRSEPYASQHSTVARWIADRRTIRACTVRVPTFAPAWVSGGDDDGAVGVGGSGRSGRGRMKPDSLTVAAFLSVAAYHGNVFPWMSENKRERETER